VKIISFFLFSTSFTRTQAKDEESRRKRFAIPRGWAREMRRKRDRKKEGGARGMGSRKVG